MGNCSCRVIFTVEITYPNYLNEYTHEELIGHSPVTYPVEGPVAKHCSTDDRPIVFLGYPDN